WMDATEPELADQQTHALSEKYIKQFGQTALGSMARYLNPYSLMTTMSVYQGFRQDFPEKRGFILTRSVFAGQQRYAAVTWSGDIPANWDVLRKQISAGINYSLAGVPYWTHDIGAFFPGTRGGLYPEGCHDPAYQELYVRWFQFGVFTPIFRSHGTGTPREVWQFGDVGHWAYDTLVQFIHLRYRLLPYIYSVAWQVTQADYTLMRGLPMDFPHDPLTYTIDNQYLFGPAFLVAPVTEELYHPARIPGAPIPTQNLRTPDGKAAGLLGEYFEGAHFETRRDSKIDAVIDFNWCGGAPDQCPINGYSVRWTGALISEEAGEYELGALADDGVRVWLDGILILDAWKVQPVGYFSKSITLQAHTQYRLQVDYFQAAGEALIRLAWRKPSAHLRDVDTHQPKSVAVYLPAGADWYDFWTGAFFKGGQTVLRSAPIEEMPLFVKAGSILPLGPFKQYAAEKPEDPIELRIYPGADAAFILYEDENDTYHYEQGQYATIPISWREASQTLTIGARQGEFPGMLKTRQFQVVWVGPNQGVGVAPDSRPATVLRYTGEALTFRR
ncbi:DUF5110 domain-containing protein, partial [candidate division KSB1 bacterium]|nr:DUF5110 domain-containing protein [candidate division KSB1 bacterium]